jgi:hypothetical protein
VEVPRDVITCSDESLPEKGWSAHDQALCRPRLRRINLEAIAGGCPQPRNPLDIVLILMITYLSWISKWSPTAAIHP